MTHITIESALLWNVLEALKASKHGNLDHQWAEEAIAVCVQALAPPTAAPAAQPAQQEPVAWEDLLGAIARGWGHPKNAHKTMDVELAVAIAKEIQDLYTTRTASTAH